MRTVPSLSLHRTSTTSVHRSIPQWNLTFSNHSNVRFLGGNACSPVCVDLCPPSGQGQGQVEDASELYPDGDMECYTDRDVWLSKKPPDAGEVHRGSRCNESTNRFVEGGHNPMRHKFCEHRANWKTANAANTQSATEYTGGRRRVGGYRVVTSAPFGRNCSLTFPRTGNEQIVSSSICVRPSPNYRVAVRYLFYSKYVMTAKTSPVSRRSVYEPRFRI